MMVLMKVSDISNEARPLSVAMPWLDCLLTEFFNQVRLKTESTIYMSCDMALCILISMFHIQLFCILKLLFMVVNIVFAFHSFKLCAQHCSE